MKIMTRLKGVKWRKRRKHASKPKQSLKWSGNLVYPYKRAGFFFKILAVYFILFSFFISVDNPTDCVGYYYAFVVRVRASIIIIMV